MIKQATYEFRLLAEKRVSDRK